MTMGTITVELPEELGAAISDFSNAFAQMSVAEQQDAVAAIQYVVRTRLQRAGQIPSAAYPARKKTLAELADGATFPVDVMEHLRTSAADLRAQFTFRHDQ